MPGELVPETYPFNYARIFNYNYFWLKYFISQRSFFALAKRPTYVNYEVLCHALSTNVIDFSQAEIYEVSNDQMSSTQLEDFLSVQNEYSFEKFALRHFQLEALEKLEE